MSRTGNGRPPLVADRRYRAPEGRESSARQAASPPPAKPPRARKSRAKSGGGGKGGNWFTRILRFFWGLIWGVTWRVGAVVALGLSAVVFYFYSQLPPLEQLVDARARGSVTLLDRDDKVFAWRGETFGGMITTETISKPLHNAVIATEDRRFYSHFGISPRGIASAIRINLSEGRGPLEGNGGSTITQQTAKLLCLGVPYDPSAWKSEAEYEADCRRGGVWRKLRELPYALALEMKYSKAEILTIYLNRAYLGAGARGFEAASQVYFGKSANQVNVQEAAMLAGLLKAPSYYAPTNNLQRSRERASVVLGLMAEQDYLTAAELASARANPASLSEAAESQTGTYFADWVMSEGPDFLTRKTTEDVIMRTTLDQRLQRAAEEAVAHIFENQVRAGSKAETAVVVMSADGAVRAMVGGRKAPAPGSFNRATMAKRQTGSAFKPFVYAAALDYGFSPADFVEDKPLTINIPGSGPWSPQNYTRKYSGLVTLTEAMEQSLNTAAVRISEAMGRDQVRRVASEFGIESDMAVGPALALGVSEASLLEMTGAYAGILNGGSAVRPFGLIDLRLRGEKDPILDQMGGIGARVISQESAQYLTYMMWRVIENGTGKRAIVPGHQAAGKTGTTSASRDAWFIGFTADYVVGVWMGYDDNSPLTGVTGGGLPADIWREVMVRVNKGLPSTPLPMLIPEPRLAPAMGANGEVYDYPAANQGGGAVQSAPNDNLADRILQEVLGIFGN